MAKVSNSLIGASRGRLGGVVFYRRKGENIIREHVSQIDDKNTGQQSQNRSAFILLVQWLSLIKGVIASYWVPSKSNQTPWSDCIGYNAMTCISNGVTVKYDQYGIPYYDRILDITQASYAQMSQAPLDGLIVANPTAGNIQITWDAANLGIGGSLTDKVNFYVINIDKKQVVQSPSPWSTARSIEVENITYPLSWSGDNTLVVCLVRPANYSLPAMQARKGGADLANVVK